MCVQISGWCLCVRVLLGGGGAREGALGRVEGLGEAIVAENAVDGSATVGLEVQQQWHHPAVLRDWKCASNAHFYFWFSSCHKYVS